MAEINGERNNNRERGQQARWEIILDTAVNLIEVAK